MDRRVVIRSFGGYLLPGTIIFECLLLAVGAFISLHWHYSLGGFWVMSGLAFVSSLVFMAITSRTFIDVDGYRVRWSFRQPPEQGDKPLSDLLRVEVFPGSGARLVFRNGLCMAGIDDFRWDQINHLTKALGEMGGQVTQMDRRR